MSLQSAFPVQHQYGDPAFNQSSWAQQTYTTALGTTSLGTSLSSPPASTNTSASSPTQTTLYNTYNAASALEQPLNATANQFGYNMTAQVSPNHQPQQTAAVWARHAAPNNKMGENLSSWHENYRWVIVVVPRSNVSERDFGAAVRGTFIYKVRPCVRCGWLVN